MERGKISPGLNLPRGNAEGRKTNTVSHVVMLCCAGIVKSTIIILLRGTQLIKQLQSSTSHRYVDILLCKVGGGGGEQGHK